MAPGRKVGRFTVVSELGHHALADLYGVEARGGPSVMLVLPDPLVQRLNRWAERLADAPDGLAVPVEVLAMPGGSACVLATEPRVGPPPGEEVARWVERVLEGLVWAHEAGLRVGVWGPLSLCGGRLWSAGLADALWGPEAQPLGHLAWRAPEQLEGRAGDARTDLYGLACTVLAVVTGRSPVEGAEDSVLRQRILAGAHTSLESHPPDLPDHATQTLRWALQRNPEARPVDARAMLRSWRGRTRTVPLSQRLAGIPTGDVFPQTRWSVVLRAGVGRREALEHLCGAYWQPLYAFARRKGASEVEAADLTQGLFAALLDRGDLGRLSMEGGRFRSWLLAAMVNHMRSERTRLRRKKRGGEAQILTLDTEGAEARYGRQMGVDGTAEVLFERVWAQTVVERARERLAVRMAERGRTRELEVLRDCLTAEGLADAAAAATALDISMGNLKVRVHRLRKLFGQCVRAEIAETVGSSALVEDEIRLLRQWLAEKGALDM